MTGDFFFSLSLRNGHFVDFVMVPFGHGCSENVLSQVKELFAMPKWQEKIILKNSKLAFSFTFKMTFFYCCQN